MDRSLSNKRFERRHKNGFKTDVGVKKEFEPCLKFAPLIQRLYCIETNTKELEGNDQTSTKHHHVENCIFESFAEENLLASADYCGQSTAAEVKAFPKTNAKNIASISNHNIFNDHCKDITDSELLNVCQSYETEKTINENEFSANSDSMQEALITSQQNGTDNIKTLCVSNIITNRSAKTCTNFVVPPVEKKNQAYNQIEVTDSELLDVCQSYEKEKCLINMKDSDNTCHLKAICPVVKTSSKQDPSLPTDYESSTDSDLSVLETSNISASMNEYSYQQRDIDPSCALKWLQTLSQTLSENETISIQTGENKDMELSPKKYDDISFVEPLNDLILNRNRVCLDNYNDDEEFRGFNNNNSKNDVSQSQTIVHISDKDLFCVDDMDDVFFQNIKTQHILKHQQRNEVTKHKPVLKTTKNPLQQSIFGEKHSQGNETTTNLVGFQTASKKELKICKKTLNCAERLIKELLDEPLDAEQYVDISNSKHESIEQKMKTDCSSKQTNQNTTLLGFQKAEETASIKQLINVSSGLELLDTTCNEMKSTEPNNRNMVDKNMNEHVIEEFMNDSSDLDLLEVIRTENETLKPASTSLLNVEKIDFQTALNKQIEIPVKYLKQSSLFIKQCMNELLNEELHCDAANNAKGENLLNENQIEKHEHGIKEEITSKRNECKTPENLQLEEEHQYKDVFTQCFKTITENSPSKKIKVPQDTEAATSIALNTSLLKRRRNAVSSSNIESPSKILCLSMPSNSTKEFVHNIQTENKTLTDFENDVTIYNNSPLIAKKKLLSLNRLQKKSICSKEFDKTNLASENNIQNSRPCSPLESNFSFNSNMFSNTSTPTNKKNERIVEDSTNEISSSNQLPKKSIKYNGFVDNLSFKSSTPSQKDRIGRLKMYGTPSELSPISLKTQHCRRIGLRRTS